MLALRLRSHSSEPGKPLSASAGERFCRSLFSSLTGLEWWLGEGFSFPLLSFLTEVEAVSQEGSLSSQLRFGIFCVELTNGPVSWKNLKVFLSPSCLTKCPVYPDLWPWSSPR